MNQAGPYPQVLLEGSWHRERTTPFSAAGVEGRCKCRECPPLPPFLQEVELTEQRSEEPKPDLTSRRRSEQELTEKQLAFLEWWITPEAQREPSTLTAWCAENHVSDETTRRWRASDAFDRQVRMRLAAMNVSPLRVQEIIDALHTVATNANHAKFVESARLYLDYVKLIMPPPAITPPEAAGPEDLTDEQLEAELARVEGTPRTTQ